MMHELFVDICATFTYVTLDRITCLQISGITIIAFRDCLRDLCLGQPTNRTCSTQDYMRS